MVKVRIHVDEDGKPYLGVFIGLVEIMQALGIGLSNSSVGKGPFGVMMKAVLDELKARATGVKRRSTRRT